MAAGSLRIICGPTAAGKSSIALELATAHNAAIISADSRQIYRHFDIGTAKPSREERETIPHYGIDVVEPSERYSAAIWAGDARSWIDTVTKAQKTSLVVGGTGLYIKALVAPLFPEPEMDGGRRKKLETQLNALSIAELRRWCAQLDPARSHLGRAQLHRAIETALLSGERISTLHERHGAKTPAELAFNPRYLVVDPVDTLQLRIENRIDTMLAADWEGEVRHLAREVPSSAPAWKAAGYRTLLAYVKGEIDLSSARERIIIETRQYAKRQRTWFRHQLPPEGVTRLDPNKSNAGDILRDWWESSE